MYRVADAKSGKSADARSAESEPNMLDRLLSLLPGSDRNAKDDETKLADSEPVRDGDILRFSAEGTDETDEYTIRQRITWDWVADYEQGVADFDWKAQRRTSAGGEWTTISAYDGSWPNTVYDQYYGVGVNGTLAELLRRPQADARPADRQARRRPAHGHGVEGAGVRHRHAVAQDVRRQDR